jgi:hypothetical protein
LEQSPEFIKFGTNSWLQHVLNINSPAWGAASDGGNIGAWQGVLVTMDEIGPICVGTSSNVPVEVYREPMPAGTVVRLKLEEGENAALLDTNGNETNEVVWTNAGSHVLVVTGKQASATVSNLLLSATVETATGQEWKQQERRFWVVGLGSLAYRWGTNDWRSATGTINVPLGTNVEFKASPSPAESSWPADKPSWTGVEGSGATVSRMFTASGIQEVIAECGNALTARVGVIFIDIAQTETNVPSSLTNAALTLTPESYWAEAGGGGVVWESSPSGLVVIAAGNGEFRFNPSASAPTSFVVRAYSDLLPVCEDVCIVNITKPPVPNVDLDGQELVALPNNWRDVPDEEEVTPGVVLISGRTKLLIKDPGTNAGKFTLAWTNPAPDKQLRLVGTERAQPPIEVDSLGPWPKEYLVETVGKWTEEDAVDVVLTHSLSAQSDTVWLVPFKVNLAGDVNLDGDISEADEANEDAEGFPGLFLRVNNNTHEVGDGEIEVDYADNIINGEEDKANDLRVLKILVPRPSPDVILYLRCADRADIRIFDERDVAILWPGTESEYRIGPAVIPAEGLQYRVEGVRGGQEARVELIARLATGEQVGKDTLKISTVGMSGADGYCIASLDKTIVVTIKDAGKKATDTCYALPKIVGANNPAEVLIRLAPGQYEDVTPSVYQRLLNGFYDTETKQWFPEEYGVCDDEVQKFAVPLPYALVYDELFQKILLYFQLLWIEAIEAGYSELEIKDGKRKYPFTTFPDEQSVYDFMLWYLDIKAEDVWQFWQVPPIVSTGDKHYNLIKIGTGTIIQHIVFTVLTLDLDGDFNHDGNVDASDPDDPEEHTTPGLLVPLNNDDDNNNGTEDKDESFVNGEKDLVKVHLGLLPDTVDAGVVIFAAIRQIKSGHIKVWNNSNKGGNPVLDTTTSGKEWKKEWPLSSSFKFGDIPKDLYVEGFNAGAEITLLLRYQNPVGKTICEDKILISVIVPEMDVGETARPANRIGWEDPRADVNATNKMLVWSTDALANKTEYDLLKYSDIPRVYYRIAQRRSWNSGYPVEDVLTVDQKTYNPVHDAKNTSYDFKVWYGPSAGERDKIGPYEVYVVSARDYNIARINVNDALGPLSDWAEAVYSKFLNGRWPDDSPWVPTDESGTVTFQAAQPPENIPFAHFTHNFGATFIVEDPVVLNGRRYPNSKATVPVYYWDASTPVNPLFRTSSRVEIVVQAFLKRIEYDELYARYLTAPPSGPGRAVQWEFSMSDHHKLYWVSDRSISLTGGNDTLFYSRLQIGLPPWTGEPLALGDVWVVGSDPANQLYGGGGHITLIVEKLPSGELKIHKDPSIDMTVEDLFDFNYWTGKYPAAGASIQCAFGRPGIGAGIGQAALLRFDVKGTVANVGDIIVSKPK